MKDKKIKLSKKRKLELIKQLENLAKENEEFFKKLLEKANMDADKITVLDRSKFMVKYIPEVMEELFEKYGTSKVLTDNDKIMKEGLRMVEKRYHQELVKKEVKKWNINYILLNCKIPKKLVLDKNTILVSYGGKSCNDHLEIMEKLFYSSGPPVSNLAEETIEKGKVFICNEYKKKNPVSILIIENIQATSDKEVYEKTKDIADKIILFLSILTNSSISLGGFIVEGKINGYRQLYPTFTTTYYPSPYMQQASFEKVLQRLIKNIKKKKFLEYALKYEKEALSEEEDKFRILKRWSAIEYLAEGYSKSIDEGDEILTKQQRNIINSEVKKLIGDEEFQKNPKLQDRIQSCIGQINHKNVKDLIFLHFSILTIFWKSELGMLNNLIFSQPTPTKLYQQS